MTFEEYRSNDATSLAQLVKDKEIDPVDLLDIAIQRAEEVNPRINAIIYPLYELAMEMTSRIDESAPFPGIPFLLKDLTIELAGTPYSEGCTGMKGYTSKHTSAMVERLKKAGLLFMGKTNTPEFGLSPYTEPKAFGPTRNPWNTDYTPGGSSGGSAAAVAAGITPFATASDGGGSIRIPASCCGLFGLKPSRGRITLGPQHQEAWQGASMEHCLSRSVRDSAALLDATCGNLLSDPYQIPAPSQPYKSIIERDPAPLRIAFCTEHTLGHAIDPECIQAVNTTVKLLSDLGHQVEEAKQPFLREDLTEVFLYMIMGETAATLDGLSKRLGRPATQKDVEPATWALALLGRTISAGTFVSAKRRWNAVSRRAAAFHEQYDLLLTPVVSTPPFPIGSLQPSGKEKRLISLVNTFGLGKVALRQIEQLAEKTYSYIPFTPFANMTGAPSMSVPLHWTAEGLPTGSMFTAPFGREDLLFQLAAQLERAQPWFDRKPESL